MSKTTYKRVRADSGKYTFGSKYERMCVCGHTLAVHAAVAPHPCFNEDKGGGGTGENCDCKRFALPKALKASKKK